LPVIGCRLPVAEFDTPHLLKVREPILREIAQTASRLRHRIETMLDSAKARGYHVRQIERPVPPEATMPHSGSRIGSAYDQKCVDA
jgi:hypothetical protein